MMKILFHRKGESIKIKYMSDKRLFLATYNHINHKDIKHVRIMPSQTTPN
jgi:uncharacterized protein YxeA